MTTRPSRFFLPLWAMGAAIIGLAAGCGGGDQDQSARASPSRGKDFPNPKQIETGPDGIVRLIGGTDPYTGLVALTDKAGALRYLACYQDGKLHGPEVKCFDDGRMRRQYDYQSGEKIHHREWFPNGNRKIDTTMKNGVASGYHRTWFEDGSTRWAGNFVDNLRWQGHIIDYSPDGKLLWDAIFEKGRYVSGLYPETEQEKMIAEGLVKPEEALYPRKPATPVPAVPAPPTVPEGVPTPPAPAPAPATSPKSAPAP